MPAHQALTGLQTAIGLVLVTTFILRATGRYKDFIPMESFWSFSKILLGLTLLWAYFWFAGLVTFWYGRTPTEQNVLKTFMFESYRIPFLLNFFFSFLIPFLLLLWNPVRKSILGPSLAGASVLIGAFFMTIRLYVPAFGIEDVTGHALEAVQLPIVPDVLDIFIILGGLAGAGLIYLLASKVFPILSIWEVKEGLLYQRVRPFLRSKYLVLGKPE
jgi:molybdopterin-containing oxidoreductase family membrane subunit